ncbi:Lipid A export ATP-binding/permease protein MsbA [Streptomyces cyanogenus]|uniref:Lipid A export ATP-binding/permease protein MsbA n=1 Tax=Streptomyces cyanogenus TaxID=80860 RepID=A0ABX7TUV8_STRCY|nr:Lipid A export ATP-binding/permease protein MsbA [Streptomyces cyanogenus]
MAARRVVKPLRRLMAGRTTIMITHDLNLAPDADRIVVVDRGRIVETGRHEELLARNGAYARLHRSQNNTILDTGELRMPLWEERQPPAPAPAYEYGQGHAYSDGHAGHDGRGYGSEAYAPAYKTAGHVPSVRPDGRPLFRNEEAWPGS